VRADGARDGEHVAQVRRSVFAGRGADRDQLEQAVGDALDGVGREFDAAGLRVALDEGIKARLVNGNIAAVQALDLGRVHVDTHHVVACIRKAGPGHQPYVAGTKNSDAHGLSS
jgi:hypothetical protein